MKPRTANLTDDAVIAITRQWVDRAVIGLNLCPFAKGVQAKGQVHYAVSRAKRPDDLLVDLIRELKTLARADPNDRDDTLLIHPDVLSDFHAFLTFLDIAETTLHDLNLEGVLQLASFHPGYQFEGTEPDDISNYTNRSPYPTVHLLRESSIDRAVAAFPEAAAIFERNIETLRVLGREGWGRLGVSAQGAKERAVSRTARPAPRTPRPGARRR
ncbi:MAG: DUF1415 domain-containing protein [Burkholderiales bacterium]